ncbi:MAG: endolytic transglycosylase MltG [Pseudomonadota bacterium]
MVRRLITAAIGLGILALGTAFWAYRSYQGFLVAGFDLPEDGVVWTLEAGTSYRGMVRELAGRDWTEDGWRWRVLGMLDDRPSRLQAGEYRLPVGTSPLELLDRLAAGDVVLYDFTIVEGWTVRQLREALVEAPGIGRTLEAGAEADFATRFELESDSAEGWFLPETYRYPRGTTDVEVLKRAHVSMVDVLATVWEERDPSLPYASPYDVLIMGSIIERETAVAEERALIAGVFVRRLQRGMRLQTDPTVIYGMGEAFDGNLRRRDLRTDTPWNTYTRHGLPVTPIALPGEAALRAAVAPADGNALYFVSRNDGTHVFSATLEEHEAAVDEFQRKRR